MTGYTQKLLEDNQPFNEFIWECSKAFMFMDRNSDNIEPFQDKSNFYENKLNHTAIELERWNNMNITEKRSKILEQKQKKVDYLENRIIENKKINDIIEKTKSELLKLNLPNILNNFRNFILDQLKKSEPYGTEKELRKQIEEIKSITLDDIDKEIIEEEKLMRNDLIRCEEEIKIKNKLNKERLNYFNELKKLVPLPKSQNSS